MNEIKTFSNDMFSILIKQDNENNLFDLETVAKSLGFTQFKKRQTIYSLGNYQ